MSGRSGDEVAEYLATLHRELGALGDEQADEIVGDVASLLREAAAEGDEALARMLAELGPADRLAARYLAERGLAPESGLMPAEWWRLGVAAVADLLVGISVPVATSLPFFIALSQGAAVASPLLWLLGALFAGSLLWPWFVWRPWRAGNGGGSAGMKAAGISVVRLAGARRVVRTRDLARLGLARPAGGAIVGVVTVLMAVVMLGGVAALVVTQLGLANEPTVLERIAGTPAEQRAAVIDQASMMYDSLVRFHSDMGGELNVDPASLDAYRALVKRAAAERISGYELSQPRRLSIGAWEIVATEKTPGGTHKVTLVYTLRIVFQPGSADSYGYGADWVLYGIRGEGLPKSPW